jgi:uracil-DNA glycosylase family 4
VGAGRELEAVGRQVERCRACPRLVAWRETVAREKRRAYASETYWGRGVAGFGDPEARLLVVGLAPAAHGANRTGRMFTGDRSGDWLYRALCRHGWASQPTSRARDDGLRLHGAFVTACVRCAPPGNRPLAEEWGRCRGFLEAELDALPRVRAIVALGGFAYDRLLGVLADRSLVVPTPRPPFAHALALDVPPYAVFASYHPSQQNTFTGRLDEPMFDAVWRAASAAAGGAPGGAGLL